MSTAKSTDTVAQEALAALRRARRRAERVALATGTYLVQSGPDGRPIQVSPRSKEELDAEEAVEARAQPEGVADPMREE